MIKMSWFDIVKKDYESITEEILEAGEHLEKLRNETESISLKLGLMTRGRTYNMLSDEEKNEWSKLTAKLKNTSKEFQKTARLALELVERAQMFAGNPDDSVKFIDENI
jgi:hypothetical protein|tara:strand:- start:131 stop:457 length:327 start_codon:yes stop_codon:yes gene_type:complete